MKKKTQKAIDFLNGIHSFIVKHPQFRKDTISRKEAQIQTEIRPLILQYLEKRCQDAGYKDPVARAHRAFYWEGQEGRYGRGRETIFGTRNYPDFIVTEPYAIAIEYKQSASGSTVKHGIGQSIIHTLSGEFDFVYLLLHGQTPDKRIANSLQHKREREIFDLMWSRYNVLIKIV